MIASPSTAAGGAAPEAAPRGSSIVRRSAWAASIALTLFLLVIASLWLRERNLPTFEQYLERFPAGEQVLGPAWSASPALSTDGSWFAGDVDPRGLDDHGSDHHLERSTLRTRIQHGEELLAEVRQEVLIAVGAADGVRRGIAVRTSVDHRAPNVRVHTRTWIEGDPLVGPGSQLVGRITGDVLLLAGAGDDRLEVARAPAGGIPEWPEAPREGLLELLRPVLLPLGGPDPEGFAAASRRSILLTERASGNGRQGIGFQEPRSWVSTLEYSYSIEQAVEHALGRSSHTWSRKLHLAFGQR